MDARRFAQALAASLSAIVPDGFLVAAEGGMLWYSLERQPRPGVNIEGKAGTYIEENFGLHGQTDEENIVGVAVQALSELQDYVSEATGSPWPGTTRQPYPHGQIRDGSLYLWYGDSGEATVSCEPISISQFL